jgi:cell division protein FtsW
VKKARLDLQGDRKIWAVVMFLSIISLLAVYSSTRTLAFNQQESSGLYLLKHFFIIVLGLVLMYVAHLVRYPKWADISKYAIIAAIILLIVTLFKGADINEAKRWVIIPIINLTFQTSDFAKLALTMFLARNLSLKQEQIQSWKGGFVPLLWPILIVCVLILYSNFSTAALLFTSSVVLLFIGRARIRHILALMAIGIGGLVVFIGILSSMPDDQQGRLGTWSTRIDSYTSGENDEGYQLKQSKIAIASGGVFGKMPGNSVQRNYLPNPFSDFIFAIITEEYGLIGATILLGLYLTLFYRCIRVSIKSPGTFGALLSVGLGFSLVFQAFINMAVAVGLLPVTGQPLPMVSMGGTSIWFTSISIGIILSISRESEKPQDEVNSAA